MLMLGLDVTIGPGKELPPHIGGALHGFVDGKVSKHAPQVYSILKPAGQNENARIAIEAPPYNQKISTSFRFGVVLFREATQSWNVIAQALIELATEKEFNNRSIKINSATICQPGSPIQAAALEGRLIEPAPKHDSPVSWIRRVRTADHHPQELALRMHCLDFRSPLLVGSRDNIRPNNEVPWPSLKTVLDSIAKRMVLEPELAETIGITHGWCASDRLKYIYPFYALAKQITWRYKGNPMPGIVGRLIYTAALSSPELALLEWGQWLGVGQKTTMGCGRYVYTPT